MQPDGLKNFVPYQIRMAVGQPQCRWLNTFGLPFSEPFFEDTASKLNLAALENGWFRSVSNLEMLNIWAADVPEIIPTALIFHVSRCGSTLISQLLATVPGHTVLSEVPVFDQILRLQLNHPEFNEQSTCELLTAALKFYGQNKSDPVQDHLFIKTDCWHLFFYGQLRRLYPHTPFFIVYRSPDAIYRSHRKRPGLHTMPHLIEPSLFGFERGDTVFETPETYLVAVINKYLEKALEIAEIDDNILLLNYNEGPIQMIGRIASFTGIRFSRQQMKIMEERSRYHSKNPNEHFREEPVTSAPSILNGAMEIYQALDKKRIATASV